MTDTLVDTDTHALGEPVVVERGGIRVSLDTLFVTYPVQLIRSDSWPDVRGGSIEHFSRQLQNQLCHQSFTYPADFLHRFNLLLVQYLDCLLPDHFTRRHSGGCTVS